MTVIIRGMKMPNSCYDCPIRKRNGMEIQCPVCGETFSVADVNIFFYRLENCPLGELQPHGRLIDALEINEVKWVHPDTAWQMGWNSAIDSILENAQTIIEAEGE